MNDVQGLLEGGGGCWQIFRTTVVLKGRTERGAPSKQVIQRNLVVVSQNDGGKIQIACDKAVEAS